MGTGGETWLGGELSVAGGVWPLGEDENLDEILENQEPRRWGDDPPLAAAILSAELLLPNPGRDCGMVFGVLGAGLAASALPFVVSEAGAGVWGRGCGGSRGCDETDVLRKVAFLATLSRP